MPAFGYCADTSSVNCSRLFRQPCWAFSVSTDPMLWPWLMKIASGTKARAAMPGLHRVLSRKWAGWEPEIARLYSRSVFDPVPVCTTTAVS